MQRKRHESPSEVVAINTGCEQAKQGQEEGGHTK